MSNDNMRIIQEQMGPVAIDSNHRANGNWGILFNTINAPENFEWGVPGYPVTDGNTVPKDEAWIVGSYFISRWTDFGKFEYSQSKPFLNIDEGHWTHSTMSVYAGKGNNKVILTPTMLHEELEKVRPKTDAEREAMAQAVYMSGGMIDPANISPGANKKIRLPLGNLYNLIAQYPTKQIRDRVRVVINPSIDPMEKKLEKSTLLITHNHPIHGMVMKIWEPARQQFYPNISPDKFYAIAPPNQDDPGAYNNLIEGQMYQCFFVDGNESMTLDQQLEFCNVVEPRYRFFKGIEIMTHESTCGYLLDKTLDEVMDSRNYKSNEILRVPFINPFIADVPIDVEYFDFPPISIDCNTLFNVLDLYKGFEWIDLYTSTEVKHPIIITGVKPNNQFPTIQTVISTLAHSKGDIR